MSRTALRLVQLCISSAVACIPVVATTQSSLDTIAFQYVSPSRGAVHSPRLDSTATATLRSAIASDEYLRGYRRVVIERFDVSALSLVGSPDSARVIAYIDSTVFMSFFRMEVTLWGGGGWRRVTHFYAPDNVSDAVRATDLRRVEDSAYVDRPAAAPSFATRELLFDDMERSWAWRGIAGDSPLKEALQEDWIQEIQRVTANAATSLVNSASATSAVPIVTAPPPSAPADPQVSHTAAPQPPHFSARFSGAIRPAIAILVFGTIILITFVAGRRSGARPEVAKVPYVAAFQTQPVPAAHSFADWTRRSGWQILCCVGLTVVCISRATSTTVKTVDPASDIAFRSNGMFVLHQIKGNDAMNVGLDLVLTVSANEMLEIQHFSQSGYMLDAMSSDRRCWASRVLRAIDFVTTTNCSPNPSTSVTHWRYDAVSDTWTHARSAWLGPAVYVRG